MTIIPYLASFAIMALAFSAAVTDVKRLEIPNIISISILALAIGRVIADLVGNPQPVEWGIGLLFPGSGAFLFEEGSRLGSLLADMALLVGVVFAMELFFRLGWLGGGDGKLIASLSLWFGLAGFTEFIILTAFAGGVLGFVVIASRFGARVTWRLNPVISTRAEAFLTDGLHRVLFTPKNPPIPYAIAIAIGAIAVEMLGSTADWSALVNQ